MTPAQVDMLTDGLIWLGDHGLEVAAAVVITCAVWATAWAAPRITDRTYRRRGIQRAELYANHPSVRAYHNTTNPARKEKP